MMVALAVLAVTSGCGLFDHSGSPATHVVATETVVATPTAATEAIPPTVIVAPMATATTEPALVTPASVADLSKPSTRLAYFHSMSERGDPPDVLARQAEIVVLTYGDELYRDALRQAGYSGIVLQYLNSAQVNGPGPYRDGEEGCDASFVPLRNGIVRDVGAFCRDLHPNEDWFLHNSAGQRLYSVVGDTAIQYHMNPANPDWRAYASQLIAGQLIGPQSPGYDGILLDNVDLSLTRLTSLAANADGVVREFASDDEYRLAWRGYLDVIRTRSGADAPIWASFVSDPNQGDYWSEYLEYLDGVMSPAFATGYDPLTAAAWENNLAQAEAALEDGVGLIAVSRGGRDDLDWQEFALASYLLIADGEQSWFRYIARDSNEELLSLWHYPNYKIALGPPDGQRARMGVAWRRDFACGYVEVDPVQRKGTIVQTDCDTGTGS